MRRLKYLEITEFGVWWETGVVPDINTEVELRLAPYTIGTAWRGWMGSQSQDDGPDTVQLRIYNNTDNFNTWFGNGKVTEIPFTSDTWYHIIINSTGMTVNDTPYAYSETGFTTAPTRELYINGINCSSFASSTYRSGKGKFDEVIIRKSGVVVADYVAALDDNDVVCFYDKVSQSYKYNSGTNHPTAGPFAFGPDVTELDIPSTGSTESIGVYSEGDWSVSTSAEWIALSVTGGTSADTAMTITCGINYGTDREGTVVFTDGTNTATLTVTQNAVNPLPFHKIIRGTLKIN